MAHILMGTVSQGQEWHISYGDQTAVVAQRGGALRSWTVAGAAVVTDVGSDEVAAAFHGAVLAPWPNRITSGRWSWDGTEQQLALTEPGTDSALHGLLSWVPWQLRHNDAVSVSLVGTILPQPGYPFAVEVSVTWSLSADGLRCDLGAVNTGPVPAPFGISTHPYFSLGVPVDELTLQLPAASWLRTDEQLHPVGLEPVDGTDQDLRAGRSLAGVRFDTAFTEVSPSADGQTSAVIIGAGRTLTVWAGPEFGWWQVYTSDYFGEGSPHQRAAVALEAMTCGPDAFNTGLDLIVLAPEEPWTGSWGARLVTT